MIFGEKLSPTEATRYWSKDWPRTSGVKAIECLESSMLGGPRWHSTGSSSWELNPLASHVFPSGSSASNPHERWFSPQTLIARIDQLEDASVAAFGFVGNRLDDLARQVSSLALATRAVDPGPEPLWPNERVVNALKSADPAATLGQEIEGDDWVDIFDHVADEGIVRPDLVPIARQALRANDPAVRSAAGRAIMVLEGAAGRGLLEEALEKEGSEYVRESLRASLEALPA